MDWFKKFKSELSRIFGAEYSDELTEAETLDKLEAQTSISEMTEELKAQKEKAGEQEQELTDQKEEIKTLTETLGKTDKTIADLAASSKKAEAGLAAEFKKFKEETATELSALKDQKTDTEDESGGKGLGPDNKSKSKKVIVSGDFVSTHLKGRIGKL